jgi:hypothetical protein
LASRCISSNSERFAELAREYLGQDVSPGTIEEVKEIAKSRDQEEVRSRGTQALRRYLETLRSMDNAAQLKALDEFLRPEGMDEGLLRFLRPQQGISEAVLQGLRPEGMDEGLLRFLRPPQGISEAVLQGLRPEGISDAPLETSLSTAGDTASDPENSEPEDESRDRNHP